MEQSDENLGHVPWEPNSFVLSDSLDYDTLGLACINAIKTEDEKSYMNIFDIIETTVISNAYLHILTNLANEEEEGNNE